MAKLENAKIVKPTNEPSALLWRCKCGNAEVQVFVGPEKREAPVHVALSAKCEKCGETIGE